LAWEEPPREDDRYPYTESVAWGDWDGDGDLDLALGNWGNPSQVYANDGGTLYLAWEEPLDDNSPNAYTRSVAWGDWDGDGDLDLALGDGGYDPRSPSRVYANESGILTLAWEEPPGVYASGSYGMTQSVAWGDWDGDGDLDLALGNAWGAPSQVYSNDTGTLTRVWEEPLDDNDWYGDTS
ncbi:MAG: VCBS repeat-containing protein, partial [Lewinella sp.]|nr:VCBS repeat-containing protein [Lewinella sp.]